MNSKQIIDFTKKWYNLGSKEVVPQDLLSPDFAEFIGSSNAFTYRIAEDEWDVVISLDKKCETAYVDLETRKIFIGGMLLNADFYNKRFGPQVESDIPYLAAAAINGCVIHEALHLKYTNVPQSFERIVKNHPSYSLFHRISPNLLFGCVNIIEDIFIEANVDESLIGFLQAVSDIFFSVNDLDKIGEEPTPQEWFSLCVLYKNKELRGHKAFSKLPNKIKSILSRVIEPRTSGLYLRDRVLYGFVLAEIIHNALGTTKVKKEEGESDEPKGGVKQTDSIEPKGGESEDSKQSPSDELGMKEQFGDEFKKAVEQTDDMKDSEIDNMISEIEHSSRKEAEKSSSKKSFEGEVFWHTPRDYDVIRDKANPNIFGTTPANVQESSDMAFLRDIVASQTTNRVPGQARKQGGRIINTRLHRIATDQKIFAKHDAVRESGKRKEIVILIDVSGSTAMNGALRAQLGVAREMSRVLTSARIPNSVYAHTTHAEYREGAHPIDRPSLVHVFSYDMQETNTNLDERFEAVRKVRLGNNCDGAILEKVSGKFTDKPSMRYIFVLSDGQPSSPDYFGEHAVDHTRKVANELRMKRFVVISFSTVKSVVEDNNKIYGRKFNIDASSNLNGQFKKVLSSIFLTN